MGLYWTSKYLKYVGSHGKNPISEVPECKGDLIGETNDKGDAKEEAGTKDLLGRLKCRAEIFVQELSWSDCERRLGPQNSKVVYKIMNLQ